jgi:hypothetical protein
VPCRCRPARRHRDCAYCGVGWADGAVCGVCKAAGIDGKTIPGTAAVACAAHKAVRS